MTRAPGRFGRVPTFTTREVPMKKSKMNKKLHVLELKKETLAELGQAALEHVIGGNKSTVPSQCPTLCFT
jgi:hypothetical protein